MRSRFAIAWTAAIILPAARAHDPITTRLTWSAEISRIVYKRCGGCHREGGSAPMSLVDYAEARPWAKAIKEEVLERRMPPAGAVKGFGDIRDDGSLTQEEVHMLADWVEGGAPEGDSSLAPEAPSVVRAAVPDPGLRPLSDQLAAGLRLEAVRLEGFPEGARIRIAARLPNGHTEPLLWIEGFREKHARTYEYRVPVVLPPHARIVRTPALAGRILVRSR